MGDTIIEKILARASGQDRVRPGDIAVCRPDMVVQLDLLLTIEGLWHRPKKLSDPDRVALVFDHAIFDGVERAVVLLIATQIVGQILWNY